MDPIARHACLVYSNLVRIVDALSTQTTDGNHHNFQRLEPVATDAASFNSGSGRPLAELESISDPFAITRLKKIVDQAAVLKQKEVD
jgi:hypothetical protein